MKGSVCREEVVRPRQPCGQSWAPLHCLPLADTPRVCGEGVGTDRDTCCTGPCSPPPLPHPPIPPLPSSHLLHRALSPPPPIPPSRLPLYPPSPSPTCLTPGFGQLLWAGLLDNVPDPLSLRQGKVAPVGSQLATVALQMKTVTVPKKCVARQKLSPNVGRPVSASSGLSGQE